MMKIVIKIALINSLIFLLSGCAAMEALSTLSGTQINTSVPIGGDHSQKIQGGDEFSFSSAAQVVIKKTSSWMSELESNLTLIIIIALFLYWTYHKRAPSDRKLIVEKDKFLSDKNMLCNDLIKTLKEISIHNRSETKK